MDSKYFGLYDCADRNYCVAGSAGRLLGQTRIRVEACRRHLGCNRARAELVLARSAAEEYRKCKCLEAFFDEACNVEVRFRLARVVSCLQIALHVFPNHITFEIHRVAGLAVADVGVLVGVGNHRNLGDVAVPTRDGETDTVNGDGTFWHDVARKFCRNFHAKPPVFAFGREMCYAADGVHVAENEVPAEFFPRGERLLKVNARAFFQLAFFCAKRSLMDCFTDKSAESLE